MLSTTKKLTVRSVLVLLTTFVSVANGYTDRMRCGSKLITSGDSKAKVLLLCKEPMLKEDLSQKIVNKSNWNNLNGYSSEAVTYINIEKWKYNRGKGKFLGVVIFRDGVVDAIEVGDRA
ncbi:DUF2845 domain-containing protein [Endozoicomonas sp. SM1973]|uniref:DUF2845 domain-containing protein n=1 Tax=Spartinivicinus marinus TaxID=2994442 RepID=A0A853I8Y6_9GAMM|nr:DUF2845 domain-containing protein [Spartinivicinus marinus]MCX4028626.1 DUF2845 domain-containing protein [Spartinivicinus marinus]NYZ67108.1 DUF2845 domain-containing protein [Spartinivicinus marinus]